jgi:hypothetical protein
MPSTSQSNLIYTNAITGEIYKDIILIKIAIKRFSNFEFFNELYIQT